MHPFGKGFRKAVRQRLDHDRSIIIIGASKALGDFVFRLADRDHKSADIIGRALAGRDKIGQAIMGLAIAFAALLAQSVKDRQNIGARLARIKLDIIPRSLCGPETDHRFGPEPLLADNALEHVLRIGKDLPRRLALLAFFQHHGIAAFDIPCLEKRGPVDIGHELAQIIRGENAGAGKIRFGRLIALPIKFRGTRPGIGQRDALFVELRAGMHLGQLFIFSPNV